MSTTRSAPTSRTYVVGLPVLVTVHDDGRVEFDVDKTEAALGVEEEGGYLPSGASIPATVVAADSAAIRAAVDAGASGEDGV